MKRKQFQGLGMTVSSFGIVTVSRVGQCPVSGLTLLSLVQCRVLGV